MRLLPKKFLRFRIFFKSKLPYLKHFFRCWIYELLHRNKLGEISKTGIRPIFIVGAGRSGNTLLARLLHETGGVHFGPENYTLKDTYFAYLKNINRPWHEKVDIILDIMARQEDAWRWTDIIDIAGLREKLGTSEERSLGAIIHEWYRAYGIAIHYPSSRWGCKTPNLTMHARQMKKIFPDALFIHIIREPLDVIQSFLKSGISGYGYPEDGAGLWYVYNAEMIRFCNYVKTDCFRLTYKELALQPHDKIAQIMEWGDIQCHSEPVQFENYDLKYKHLRKVGTDISFSNYERYEFDTDDYSCLEKCYEKWSSQSPIVLS